MDWQDIAALSIVAGTLVVVALRRLRPGKFSFQRQTLCGGCSAGHSGQASSLVLHARKGGRPVLTVRMR